MTADEEDRAVLAAQQVIDRLLVKWPLAARLWEVELKEIFIIDFLMELRRNSP